MSGNYRADPGGVFASDVHRRVLAHLPSPDHLDHVAQRADSEPGFKPRLGDAPLTVDGLIARIAPDAFVPFAVPDQHGQAVLDVLEDLEDAGYAETTADGDWAMTAGGFEALTGPNLTHPDPDNPEGYIEPPPLDPDAAAAVEKANAEMKAEDEARAAAQAAEELAKAADEAAAEADRLRAIAEGED